MLITDKTVMKAAIDNPAIVKLDVRYGFKGARACNTFVALKEAGIRDDSIHFGSWNEWLRDPNLPIDGGVPAAFAIAV